VHRPRYDDWSLPKGKADRGEHAVVAAVREVAEETGLSVRLGRPLGVQHYEVTTKSGQRAAKEVRYWAAQLLDGADGPFQPNDEVDELAWLPITEAAARLTWERDSDVLDAFAAGPLRTVPVIVLRHAQAVPRSQWSGSDDEHRPLSPLGERQAAHLVPMLRAYGVRRVVSSPARRCVDTVAAYATATGATVRTDRALTERTDGSDGAATMPALTALLHADEPGLVCTHRPAIPALLDALAEVSDQAIAAHMLKKGEFLVAHAAGGRVVAVERHTP